MPPEGDLDKVAMEMERVEEDGGVVGETYTDYRPAKLFTGLQHPNPVVESSSLAAVQPPQPTYNLQIKDYLENSKALSCLQIETLVYACQRHLHHLADGTRAGFFIGDGAGIGKGRTIAGLILENWHHGRKKALWISTSSDMAFDARRDLDDAGATWIQIHSLNKIPYTKSLDTSEGVVFLSYHCLIASYSDKGKRRSRLEQLVDWCGPGYDGLIVFDECHKAKNLAPEDGRGTHTGLAVVEIQAKLPEARVIYCSATGASVPRNMAYMVRLGLWGDGTCFPKFRFFLRALEKGGTGTLELVAMEMKGRGMYLSRTLSYKGAEFDVVEVPLAAKMTNMYKKAAEFWAELRKELIYAIDNFSSTSTAFSQLWRLYWSNHQRFFRQMCVSAKVPAAVRLAIQALADSKCVVIGLQTTGEARTEEAVTKYGVELDDFISGPREILIKFIESNYPLPEEPESLSGDGGVNGSKRKRDSATPDVSFKGRAREEESEADSEPKLTLEDEFYKSENMSQEEKKCEWNSRVDTPANSSCKVNGYPSFAPKPENTEINQMAKRRKGGSASIKTEPKDFDDTKGNIKDIVYIDDEILPTYPASDASSNASIKTEPKNFVAVNGNFIDLVVIDDEILPTDPASDASRKHVGRSSVSDYARRRMEVGYLQKGNTRGVFPRLPLRCLS